VYDYGDVVVVAAAVDGGTCCPHIYYLLAFSRVQKSLLPPPCFLVFLVSPKLASQLRL